MSYLATKALNDVLNRFRPEQIRCAIIGIADDTYICGPVNDAVKAVSQLGPILKAELDVEFAIRKFAAYVPAGPTDADITALTAANIPVTEGVVAAGTPIGSRDFVTTFIASKVQQVRSLAEQIVALKNVKPFELKEPVLLQGLFAIVRMCLPPVFSHLLRTIYPSIIGPFARQVDDIVLRTALSCCGHGKLADADSNDAELHRVSKRVFLSTSQGGLGVFSCHSNMQAAFIGSASLTCETVRELGHKPPDPDFTPTISARQRTLECQSPRSRSRPPPLLTTIHRPRRSTYRANSSIPSAFMSNQNAYAPQAMRS